MNSNPEIIPTTFIRHAADVLGDTQSSLSGTKIIEATAAYAVQLNVDIPHTHMSIKIPNITGGTGGRSMEVKVRGNWLSTQPNSPLHRDRVPRPVSDWR